MGLFEAANGGTLFLEGARRGPVCAEQPQSGADARPYPPRRPDRPAA
ncbi:MAG: hypothetical protein L0099_11595 [Acidobacteria bacterium]|nr:hypothetical protein [Acidobacteriota bacterium]